MRAAVLGLGEAGGRYAADLAAAGWQLHGFDPGPVPTPPGVLRAQSVAAAVADAELIIALTGASAAVSAAQAAAVSAPQDCCYADFNSSSAALKRQVEAAIATAGGMQMADVAVLAPVGRLGAASPLAVSGPGATAVADAFGAVGAQVEVLDGPVGDAAGRKLLRSVFMKGLAAAVLEAVAAARVAGCEPWIRDQIAAELGPDGNDMTTRLIDGSAKHAVRRIAEVEASKEYLAELGVRPLVCDAALGWLEDLRDHS